MSYDISYEEKNGRLYVKCNKELYRDIIKKFGGKWHNMSDKFIVPLDKKSDIESLIDNVKALQNDASNEDEKENDMDTPFVENQIQPDNPPVESKLDTTHVENDFVSSTVNPVENEYVSQAENHLEYENKNDYVESDTPQDVSEYKNDYVESDTPQDVSEYKNEYVDSESQQAVEFQPRLESKTKKTKIVPESKTKTHLSLERKTKKTKNNTQYPSIEETFLKSDILEVNKSDIESEDDFIPISNFQKQVSAKVKNPPKPISKTKQSKIEKPVFQVVKKSYENPKSRFETDSVNYNQYNSDDQDIYEDEEGEEESESGEESESDGSYRKKYSSEESYYKRRKTDSESDYKKSSSKQKRKNNDSDSDYKKSSSKQKRKNNDSDSDYKKSSSKQKRKNTDSEYDSESDYKKSSSKQQRKNTDSDYESIRDCSQKHYTKEEKEKLKRKIELLELKKAKKLGKSIEDVRAERKQTSVRFTELVKKVQRLQEQVEDLQYQIKKIYRR